MAARQVDDREAAHTERDAVGPGALVVGAAVRDHLAHPPQKGGARRPVSSPSIDESSDAAHRKNSRRDLLASLQRSVCERVALKRLARSRPTNTTRLIFTGPAGLGTALRPYVTHIIAAG